MTNFIRKIFDATDVLFDDIKVSFDGLFEVIGQIAQGGGGHKRPPRHQVKKFYKYYNVDGTKHFEFYKFVQIIGTVKILFIKTKDVLGSFLSVYKTFFAIQSNIKKFTEDCSIISGTVAEKIFLKSFNMISYIKVETRKKLEISSNIRKFLSETKNIKANQKNEFQKENIIKGTRDLKSLLEALDIL